MSEWLLLLLVICGCGLFVAGIYTGLHVARTNKEIITNERVIEKLVTVEPPKKPEPSIDKMGPVVMGTRKHAVVDDQTRDANTRMSQLISQFPEG